MAFLIVLTLILLTKLWLRSEAEFYTSIADMNTLVVTHGSVIQDLNDYVEKEQRRINIVKYHLERYKREHQAMLDFSNYVGNPVNAYTLIKRLTIELSLIETLLKDKIAYEKNMELVYPTQKDLDGATNGVGRLQFIYNLNVTELAEGILTGTFSENKTKYTEIFSPMSSSDCYELGLSFYKRNDYRNSLRWLLEAYKKYPAEEELGYNFTMTHIVKRIRYCYYTLGDTRTASEWTRRLYNQDPEDPQRRQLNAYKDIIYKKFGGNKTAESTLSVPRLESCELLQGICECSENIHMSLCRGEFPEHSATSRLKCRYLTETHPFLRIAPIKLEELNDYLDLVILYDVISDEEIRHLQDIAQPELARSLVFYQGKMKNEASEDRISKSAVFSSHHTPTLTKLNNRVSQFTGIPDHMSEKIQISNYGIGGAFYPHIDTCTEEPCMDIMRRYATVLIYMSEVTQGGATVFLDHRLVVYPKKGAALFWTNIDPETEGILDSLHAGCPVLRGSKWVANKWLTSRSSEAICSNNYSVYQEIESTVYKYTFGEDTRTY